MTKNKPGPTGDFPQGKLNEDDEGGLQIGVTTESGKVVIEFGTPIRWIAMAPEQAIELGKLLTQRAEAINDRR